MIKTKGKPVNLRYTDGRVDYYSANTFRWTQLLSESSTADPTLKFRLDKISYESLPKSDLRTRFCVHRAYTYETFPISGSEANVAYSDHELRLFNWNHEHNAGTLSTEAFLTQPISTLADDEDFSFNQRAYAAMKPSLEGDVSATNFLLELGDLKQLLRFFSGLGSLSTKKSIPEYLEELTKKVSEGHLTWEFGIRPILNDLNEIWTGIANYEKRIAEFIERSKGEQKRYYSEKVPQAVHEDTVSSSNDRTFKSIYKCSIKRVATMSYTYKITEDLNSLVGRLRAIQAILGLKASASVIWEAIPFSFLVDYVLNVGEFLRSIEDDLIEPDVEIIDYSISYKLTFDRKLMCTYPNYPSGYEEYMCSRTNGTMYQRTRALPDTGGAPLTMSLPGSNQLALSLSLFNVIRH